MNKKAGILFWAILGLFIFLLVAGIIYFKFNTDSVSLSAGESSININYNGSIQIGVDKAKVNNETGNNTSVNNSQDYKISFNMSETGEQSLENLNSSQE
jgi:hypothetical protein